mmetsp:Transcript_119543/g.273996  ORF Transcript_119543/g.273996 Transcript_119543/m.273996 type:complete len:324 (-) Transcript_119543:165-1136(-)
MPVTPASHLPTGQRVEDDPFPAPAENTPLDDALNAPKEERTPREQEGEEDIGDEEGEEGGESEEAPPESEGEEDELVKIRRLITEYLEADPPDRWRAAVTQDELGCYYMRHGMYDLALHAFQDALAMYREREQQELEMYLVSRMAEANIALGFYATATELHAERVDYYREAEDKRGLALALVELARCQELQGLTQMSLDSVQEAQPLEEELYSDNVQGLTRASMARGVLQQARDPEQKHKVKTSKHALAHAERARIHDRNAGDEWGEMEMALLLEDIAGSIYNVDDRLEYLGRVAGTEFEFTPLPEPPARPAAYGAAAATTTT